MGMWITDRMFPLPPLLSAIKVNCQGSCGISSRVNDTSWTMEEQYFNSTLSVADKGDDGHTVTDLFLVFQLHCSFILNSS